MKPAQVRLESGFVEASPTLKSMGVQAIFGLIIDCGQDHSSITVSTMEDMLEVREALKLAVHNVEQAIKALEDEG